LIEGSTDGSAAILSEYAAKDLRYHAQRFVSISDRYYHYRYGIGVSTKKTYDIPEFWRVLCKFDTLCVIRSESECSICRPNQGIRPLH